MTLAAPAVVAVLAILARPAASQDWAAPITAAQKSLADAGVSIGGGVTGFGQGMGFGDGIYGVPFGGKADFLLGLDGGLLGLWNGLGVSAHFEQQRNAALEIPRRKASSRPAGQVEIRSHDRSNAGRATSSSRVPWRPIFRRHGSRSMRRPSGRSTALCRRCAKSSSTAFAWVRSHLAPSSAHCSRDWLPEKLREAKESGSLLEASEVANVVMFMLTRPPA
jgi:hypothetical protein